MPSARLESNVCCIAENLLLDGDGYLRVADFGFAKRVGEGRTYTICGTPDYQVRPAPPPAMCRKPSTCSIAPPVRSRDSSCVGCNVSMCDMCWCAHSLRPHRSCIKMIHVIMQAPEVIQRKGTGCASDWWGLGVLVFEMLTGDPPFKAVSSDPYDTFRRALAGSFELPDCLSPEACDLTSSLLQVSRLVVQLAAVCRMLLTVPMAGCERGVIEQYAIGIVQ